MRFPVPDASALFPEAMQDLPKSRFICDKRVLEPGQQLERFVETFQSFLRREFVSRTGH
jgi:hypothetical protein